MKYQQNSKEEQLLLHPKNVKQTHGQDFASMQMVPALSPTELLWMVWINGSKEVKAFTKTTSMMMPKYFLITSPKRTQWGSHPKRDSKEGKLRTKNFSENIQTWMVSTQTMPPNTSTGVLGLKACQNQHTKSENTHHAVLSSGPTDPYNI